MSEEAANPFVFFVFFQSPLTGNDSFKPKKCENVLIDDHEGKSEARLLGETLAQGWFSFLA